MHDVEAGLPLGLPLGLLVREVPPRTRGVLSSGLAQLAQHLGVDLPLLGRDDRAVVRGQRGDHRANLLMLLGTQRSGTWL